MAGRSKWLRVLVILLVVTVVGGVFWFAHDRGWLTTAYTWVHHRGMQSRSGGTGQSDMNMDMPGMGDMPMSETGTASVPDHAPVTIPGEVRQRIGVTVGTVKEDQLRMSVRTVGIVQADEVKVAHIHLKTEGWVEKVFVSYTGQKVKKGDALLAIYSPQFLTTQQEYLNARESKQPALAELARRRLELWDVPADEIKELDNTGKPHKYLALRSPLEGTVLVKNAFAGQYITPEKELYVLADLSTVWVQAKVYEHEIPHVEVGQPVTVTVPDLPGRALAGKVVFIQPTVDEKTRTVQVRIELANPEGFLKPGMFAHVTIQHRMGDGLLVPASAVIRTGERDIAYRAESEGRFIPVEIKISPYQYGDRFHVLEGLKAGDRVSTSANFLIDSESRLRAGGGGMAGMDMGNMPGMDMGGKEKSDKSDKKGMKGMDPAKMKE